MLSFNTVCTSTGSDFRVQSHNFINIILQSVPAHFKRASLSFMTSFLKSFTPRLTVECGLQRSDFDSSYISFIATLAKFAQCQSLESRYVL